MAIICNYNLKAGIFSFYSKELDRVFTCNAQGNPPAGGGSQCMRWEHTKFPETDENIPEAAYVSASAFFSKLIAEKSAPSLMATWASVH